MARVSQGASAMTDPGRITGATRLYERAGMYVAFEAVVYEKRLPGL